jgi:hypothetical protein
VVKHRRFLSLALLLFAVLFVLSFSSLNIMPEQTALGLSQVAAQGPTPTPNDPVWVAFSAARRALEDKIKRNIQFVQQYTWTETEFTEGISSCRVLSEGESPQFLFFGYRFNITLLDGRQFEVRTSFDATIVVVCDQVTQGAPAVAAPAAPGGAPPPVVGAGATGAFEVGGHIATFGNLAVAQSAGMTWVKKQIRWRRGEGTGSAAGIIASAKASNFKVLLGIVGYREELAADFEGYTNDFATYLGQVAALAPNAIEVWNEPNIDREWPAGIISGDKYTVMLAKAFNAIKAANSSVMVISGAPAPTGFFQTGCANEGCNDDIFLRQMAQANAAQYMDCVGAHYNEGIISPTQQTGDPRGGHYSRYFSAMLNLYSGTFGGTRPVCWTELGFLTPEGYGPLPGAFAWAQNTTLAQHAQWLGEATRLSRTSGRVRLLIVWNVDFQVYDSDPQAGYAIIRKDGSCPACAAIRAGLSG